MEKRARKDDEEHVFTSRFWRGKGEDNVCKLNITTVMERG